MDLWSRYPFWLLKNGIIRSYPSLNKDIHTEIVIIGSGITGALMAYHLGKAGMKVTIVDRRHVGMGSTVATTGLLQYEIDVPLRKLITLVGERNAVRSYELCVEAISKLHQIIQIMSSRADFKFKPSFQYASARSHVKKLEEEFKLRKQYRLAEVEWLNQADIKNKFGFKAPAGLFSREGAQVNAYELTHNLLEYCCTNFNVEVYDSTNITQIKHSAGKVTLKTAEDKNITAKKLVVCAGYESENYLPRKVEKKAVTYAIVSEPLDKDQFWYKDSLIWETAIPYLYMRSTMDHRILIGGCDDRFYNLDRLNSKVGSKARKLVKEFKSKFPHIPFKIDFQWAGVFCGTRDGLPYIGSVGALSNTYFALGFGGNGITFSLMAAEIITDMIKQNKNKDAELFSFDRA
jgi:glycine/D-amino acid oxidase-like deaminating enzyme